MAEHRSSATGFKIPYILALHIGHDLHFYHLLTSIKKKHNTIKMLKPRILLLGKIEQ